MSNGGDPKLKFWSLLLIIGSGLVFLAFFMPWWSLKFPLNPPPTSPGRNASREDRADYSKKMQEYMEDNKDKFQKASKVLSKNERWYKAKLADKYADAQKQGREDGGTVTVRLWGWSVGVALAAFIMSFVLLPAAIVPMFVRLLRNWIWTGYFAAAVMGLILLILSMVWYFSSPGENVSGMLSQGVGFQPGPYMHLLGSLCILAAGVLGGVFGLLHFLKTLKQPKAAAAPVRPVLDEDEFIEE